MMVYLRSLVVLTLYTLLTSYNSVFVSATTITFYNKCPHPVWPGIQPSAGKPLLARGGFKLPPNKGYSLRLPALWSGRFWGRHGCAFDASGRGKCATGDCGGALYCNGIGGAPPATLAEITLGNDQDFYDVSLVDGYNLAMSITPSKGSGKCSYAGCVSDLNMICPVGLQVRSHDDHRVVACKSACSAFNSPRYCCTGRFGNPQSCKPTAYSKIFKTACPKAYSYAYDDPTSIATCTWLSGVCLFQITAISTEGRRALKVSREELSRAQRPATCWGAYKRIFNLNVSVYQYNVPNQFNFSGSRKNRLINKQPPLSGKFVVIIPLNASKINQLQPKTSIFCCFLSS